MARANLPGGLRGFPLGAVGRQGHGAGRSARASPDAVLRGLTPGSGWHLSR